MLRINLLLVSLVLFTACSEDKETSSEKNPEPSEEIVDSIGTDSSEFSEEIYHEELDSSQLSDVLTQKINPLIEDYPADSANPAAITWDTIHHDFGVLKEGESVEFDFHLTNTGQSPLVIAEAYSSCGCTIPSFPIEPILPGKRSSIHVRFNSEGKEGNIFKRIVVLANTYPEKANVVSISCQVEK